ncbi:MAG TPA: aminotransferase class III-fold pyridoxal phosphate-dependent enzyme [Stellaceae bacterium]|nr:aminotransferase class III-fold pyridoxal phosphate-dependent enzyme [Stellaceae bacterium]
MSSTDLSNSRIVAAYRGRTERSAELARQAQELLPSGITHDARYLKPYGIYVERAKGPRKWDVDGNEYVDYYGGHGALLLGHNNPTVVAAAQGALERGTHFGANHPNEVRWAEQVRRMVPSAERVRFTSSGTEATLMALRLARAFTGRKKILRFMTHFHGWHDHMTAGHNSHFDGSPTAGTIAEIAASTILLPPGDIAALKRTIEGNDDIAAAILEPTGASFGVVPVSSEFLAALREATAKRGIILIFDEVVTGFRVSPGGAQGRFGIKPDLTALAKILAGGLPGGAICGRREILEELDFEVTAAKGHEKIAHPGTYNGNPVSAAAGVAALGIVESTDACARANAYANELRHRLNEVLAAERVPWAVYGTFSGFHTFLNPRNRDLAGGFDPAALDHAELTANSKALQQKLRIALLVNGVDLNGRLSGFASATHDRAEMNQTVSAFGAALRMLREEGELPQR